MSDPNLSDTGLPPLAVSFLTAAIRHGVGWVGAALVTHGVATVNQEASFEQVAVGAVGLAISLGWSWLQKRNAKTAAAAAVTKAAKP